MNLHGAILSRYGSQVTGGIGSFRQMGHTEAESAAHALETIRGPYTVKNISAAFEAVNDCDAGQSCQPWTFGDHSMHIPHNVDRTVTPDNGQIVIAQGCRAVFSADPQIAEHRKIAGG